MFFWVSSAQAEENCSSLLISPNSRRVLYQNVSSGEVAEVRGAPKGTRLYPIQEHEVFRHYVADPALLDHILQEQNLRAGFLPYIVSEPGLKKEYFVDLTGAFITKPGFEPHQVGLGRSPRMDYLDLTLDPTTELLQIETGIFLLPGKPLHPKWIQDAFDEWRSGIFKEYSAGYVALFRRIHAAIGRPELMVPIRILSVRKGGLLTEGSSH